MSNIKEAEEQTGISRANIRYYEKMGLLQPKRNEKNGYREYRPEDIKRILQIKILRKLDVPIEEIKDTFDRPEMLGKVIQKQKERLEKQRAELTDAIDFCEEIKEENLGEFDPQYYLKKMDEKEKKGAVFADLLNDFKKVSKAEAEARFSFRPDTMCMNPKEFEEALLQYASEKGMKIVITKKGMYPEFMLDGIPYSAYRHFSRFGAMIECETTNAKTAEHEMSPKRYHMFKWLHRMELPTFLLILILVLFVRSVEGFVLAMIFYAICGIVAYSRYFDYMRNS